MGHPFSSIFHAASTPNRALAHAFAGHSGPQAGPVGPSNLTPPMRDALAGSGNSGRMGIGLPNVHHPSAPSQNPAWNYNSPSGLGTSYGGPPSQLPYQALDQNSTDPAWKQLGFYRPEDWRFAGKPKETGLPIPSLTDPNTGIYHYENYTPEYADAFQKAIMSNYRPAQPRPATATARSGG